MHQRVCSHLGSLTSVLTLSLLTQCSSVRMRTVGNCPVDSRAHLQWPQLRHQQLIRFSLSPQLE